MEIGDVAYASTLAFERKFRVYIEERVGTIWDTRFVRPLERDGGGRAAVLVLLDGWLHWHAHPLGALRAPAVLVASQDVIDGMRGSELVHSSGGDPFRAVQLRLVDGPDLDDERPRAIAASAAIVDAARAVVASSSRDETLRDPVGALLDACAAAGVAPRGLAATITREESKNLTRIWAALRARHLLVDQFPVLQRVVDAAGLSSRHVARALDEVFAAFSLEWSGWRDVINDMRLRWAVMLLSSTSVSINDVARSAGYGSVTALGGALRKAGLPGPRDVRTLILAGEAERLARAGG